MGNNEYYIELINKYFANEINEEELNKLSFWLNESEENKAVFEEYRKTWMAINRVMIEKSIDVNEEWQRIKENLPTENSLNSGSNFNKRAFNSFLKIAAVFILLVAGSYVLNFIFEKYSLNKIIANNNVIEYSFPDSSQVYINNGYIEFKKDFKDKTIKMQGEAFFSIKHKNKKPYTVFAENLAIQDIGTEFYVNTHDGSKVTVILNEGVVVLYMLNDPQNKVILKVGQRAEFDKRTRKIITMENTDYNYLSWKTKEFVFNNMTLNDVVSVLNKAYKCNIIIKDDFIKNYKLTAEFKKQSIESILNVLKATLNLRIIKTSESFELYGNVSK
jgi:ferric-dicitrate binding protein FerR (iron transport regulator)